MRRTSPIDLKPGMVLAKPIYAKNGIMLLKGGTKLTEDYIAKILFLRPPYIYIVDNASEGKVPDRSVCEETVDDVRRILIESITCISKVRFDNEDLIVNKVKEIIDEVLSDPQVMMNVQELHNMGDYLLKHSVNVCVLSLLMGVKKGYNDSQLKHLALGAILHDIGKTKVEGIDEARYREEYVDLELNRYKDHVHQGYEIIKKITDSSILAANVALTHHENFDGTGFPMGKKNESIHDFSRIVAIANEYDNLVYNRRGMDSLKHYEVVELIASRVYSWFDPEMVRIFRNSISPYPIGSGVELSDGRKGIVSRLNAKRPTRPVILLVADSVSAKEAEEVDLSRVMNISITDDTVIEDTF